MNILDEIVARKYLEVTERKSVCPVSVLEKSSFFHETRRSLKKSILEEGSTGIIAEFKRISPSEGIINLISNAHLVCHEYQKGGASAVSVLTDSHFFGGSSEDLSSVRMNVNCPVLRKDFILDEYQIIEARSIGADAVLLIAELHPAKKLEELFRFAQSLDLEVLVELHDEKNISKIPYDANLIGINSRNLKSFRVNPDHLSSLVRLLPEKTVKVAESGIRSALDYFELKKTGFEAFLIGTVFMKTINPGRTFKNFTEAIRNNSVSSDLASQNIKG